MFNHVPPNYDEYSVNWFREIYYTNTKWLGTQAVRLWEHYEALVRKLRLWFIVSLLIVATMTSAGYYTGYQDAYRRQEAQVLACGAAWWQTMDALNYALSNQK